MDQVTSPSDAPKPGIDATLAGISRGDMNYDRIIRFVKDGHKLDNFAMRKLIDNLRNKYNYDDRVLLEIYLTLDKAAEEGMLTNDMVDQLVSNPSQFN